MVVTTVEGVIEYVNPAAAHLLNTSAPHCRGRNLLLWFARDRIEIAHLLSHAVLGHPVDRTALLRPRERRSLPVQFHLVLMKDDEGELLRWSFSPESLDSTRSTTAGTILEDIDAA